MAEASPEARCPADCRLRLQSLRVTLLLCLLCSQAVSSGDEKEGLKHPGLMLKYSTFKNLAQLAAQREDLETAMEFYLEVLPSAGSLGVPGGGVGLWSGWLKSMWCCVSCSAQGPRQ